MLTFENNEFNGIIINSEQLPENADVFSEKLQALISYGNSEQKSVIWITLAIQQANLITAATQLGFTFHNCLPKEVTLVFKYHPDNYTPFIPTHSLGAGGFVQDSDGNMLVIRERGATTYKLPGGHLDLGEKISDGVIREVFEETGIQTTFSEILGMASTHPYRFGKSNIYIVCKLDPVSTLIDIQDTLEIDDAKWIHPQDFLADSNNGIFNKYLIKSLLNATGLSQSTLDLSQFSNRKHEVFLANREQN